MCGSPTQTPRPDPGMPWLRHWKRRRRMRRRGTMRRRRERENEEEEEEEEESCWFLQYRTEIFTLIPIGRSRVFKHLNGGIHGIVVAQNFPHENKHNVFHRPLIWDHKSGLLYFQGNMFIFRTAGNTGKYREIQNFKKWTFSRSCSGRAYMLEVDKIMY